MTQEKKSSKWWIALIAVPFLMVAPMLVVVGLVLVASAGSASACEAPAVTVDGKSLPGEVAGFKGEQLSNAVILMSQAKSLNMSVGAQIIVVQAAIGESTLTNTQKTDEAGTVNGEAITIGILQQDKSYGPREDRLNVAKAGKAFLTRLGKVPGWESMEPTLAIHAVQINQDPYHYTKFRAPAMQVVEALSNAKVSTGDGGGCSGVPGDLGKDDDYPWKNTVHNADNPVTHFAYRNCTDFAWWRLMQQLGTPQPPFAMDSLKLAPGHGGQWGAAWKRVGWEVSMTPKVGAVIWYAPNANGVGSYGHVAIVKAINADGTVLEEGYNFGMPPTGEYYTRTIEPSYPSGYLYLPTKDQLASVA